MAKHVAFVGPDIFSAYVDMVRGLKQAGALVTGIGATPKARLDPELAGWMDHWEHVPNLHSAGAVFEAVKRVDRMKPVDLLETGEEALVMPVAQARQALELPGLTVRSATLCRDKPAMKDALRKAGVPCAASAAVSTAAELRAFVEREGFPVILKPRSALGGLGTHRVDNVAELAKAAESLGLGQGNSVAVEEFVEGHEGFYDTLSVDGRPVREYISHYYPSVLHALSDRNVAPQIAATNRVDIDSYAELREMGRKVIAALGIGTSATHMEWFYGPKGLKFSEIGARPPGERIWDLYSAGNDLDMWFEWGAVTVHGRPAATPSRRFASGSVQVRPPADGKIVGYENLERVLEKIHPYVFAFRLPKPGTPTDPIYKGYLNNVWFRLRHPDYDTLRGLLDFVGNTLRIRVG